MLCIEDFVMLLHRLFLTSLSTNVKLWSFFSTTLWVVESYIAVCCNQSL